MSRQVQFIRGNTQCINHYVGPIGSFAINVDDWSIHIQDGVTPGGHIVTGTGGTNTGNISFLQDLIYDVYGMTLQNATPPNGAGASISIPPITGGDVVTVNNQGNVLIFTDQYTNYQWKFDVFGNTTIPGGIFMGGSYVTVSGGDLYIDGQQVQGLQGPQGEVGPQGAQGNVGPQGIQGIQGIQGNVGEQGIQGIQGNTGPQGIQGIQGIQGNVGAQGAQGIQGNTGPQGEQGLQGIQGNVGATGPQGIQGNVGPQGAQGIQGIQGNIGAQGIQGIQGNIGPQGIQGIQGIQGNVGEQGPRGFTGNVGEQGPQGDLGPKGNTGAQGTSVTLLGSLQFVANLPMTANAGEGWIVQQYGNLYLWNTITSTWNDIGKIVGPQGDSGPQGPRGFTGNVGPEGPQGVQGSAGPQGIQGNIGPSGPQGEQGIQGNTGPQGAQGIQGNVGPQGIQGIQGIQGNTGPQGIQGIQGNVGAQGIQGIQGIQGNTGPQGIQGIQGNVGAQGPQGEQGIQGNTGSQGDPGQGVPVGGTTNQVLAKVSSTNYDTYWIDMSATGSNVTVSDTSPALGTGNLWYDTVDGRLYVGYDGFWIDANPPITTINTYGNSNVQSYLTENNYLTSGDLSVARSATAVAGGNLTYNNTSGVFTYNPVDLSTYATQTYVTTQVNNLIGSAPGTLDTLGEIAAALNNDANLTVTLTNLINASNVAWQANATAQQATINTLLANAAAQQTLISSLQASVYSNVNTQSYLVTNNYLTTSTANLSLYAWNANITNYSNVNTISYLVTNNYLTVSSANLSLYAWNANVTAITTAWQANALAQQTLISNLEANAASQQTQIANLQSGGYSNVNLASYGGNIIATVNGFAIGYRDIPQISLLGNVTLTGTDAGKHYYSTLGNVATITIANANVQAFNIGTAVNIINQGTGNIVITQGSGVSLYLAGNSTASNRTLTSYGMATVQKVNTNTWFIVGVGLS